MLVIFFRYVLLMVGLTDRIRAGWWYPPDHTRRNQSLLQPRGHRTAKAKSHRVIYTVTFWLPGLHFNRYNLSPLGLRDPCVQRNCVRYWIRHPSRGLGCTTAIWKAQLEEGISNKYVWWPYQYHGHLKTNCKLESHCNIGDVASQVCQPTAGFRTHSRSHRNLTKPWPLVRRRRPVPAPNDLTRSPSLHQMFKSCRRRTKHAPNYNHQALAIGAKKGPSCYPLRQMPGCKWCKEAPACTKWPPNPLRRPSSCFDPLQRKIWISPEIENNWWCNQLLHQ